MRLDTDFRRAVSGPRIPRAILGVGVLFSLAFVGEWAVFGGVSADSLGSTDFLVALLVAVIFNASIVYGGLRLERSDISRERYPRIGKWILGCSAVFFAINLPMIVARVPDDPQSQLGWGRFAVSVGVAGGLLVGGIEAQAIQRSRVAERATVRAEAAEDHHQHLDYLNSLLRHEVLNTANVITGYASLLLEDDDLDPDARDRLETIHRQGRDMTQVIRDVQVLIRATRGTVEREPRNLSATLADELDDLRRTHESVETAASIPDDVRVRANDLLPRVFSNLLVNAVEHNDGPTPRVEVTVEASADTATVYIADDGPGIPAGERVGLFERGDNTGGAHGLGLYLVDTLVDRYGGSVELTETGPDGSTFAVALPVWNSRDA